jgi:hypothetical protein
MGARLCWQNLPETHCFAGIVVERNCLCRNLGFYQGMEPDCLVSGVGGPGLAGLNERTDAENDKDPANDRHGAGHLEGDHVADPLDQELDNAHDSPQEAQQTEQNGSVHGMFAHRFLVSQNAQKQDRGAKEGRNPGCHACRACAEVASCAQSDQDQSDQDGDMFHRRCSFKASGSEISLGGCQCKL